MGRENGASRCHYSKGDDRDVAKTFDHGSLFGIPYSVSSLAFFTTTEQRETGGFFGSGAGGPQLLVLLTVQYTLMRLQPLEYEGSGIALLSQAV